MDKEIILEKLINKTHVSYDEGREALERCRWNILDAILILEDEGKVKKPNVSIYYTNEPYEKINKKEIVNIEYKKERSKSIFQQFIELICSLIDKCNNIFFKIIRNNKVLIKFPLTVIILFLIFAFWVIVPLFITGFFFDIEYRFEGRNMEGNEINKVLKKISDEVRRRKENKRGRKYD